MKIEILNNYITDNSNECENGCFFLHTKANTKFQNDAVLKGAKVIEHHEAVKLLEIDENLKIIGITGTNGKTTTAALIAHILGSMGYSVCLCGTRGAFINNERIDEKGLTTSSVIKILEYLQKASKAKCHFLVMEVSSHAIDQERIEGLSFTVKVFTNISQDHLDYHKSMQEYIKVKNSFFSDESLKVINIDDENVKFNTKNTLTYSLKNPNSDFFAYEFDLKNNINSKIKSQNSILELNSCLVGEFNLYNILAAFACVKALFGYKDEEILKAIKGFGGVEGRMQVVSTSPLVIVDFAHTPDGIEKVLNSLKQNSLIVIFGAGGNRDKTKRPIMGQMVQKFAKKCIITSDNPRFEDPKVIIDEIFAGMKESDNIFKFVDRKEAIEFGLKSVENNDIVVILGKGDEDYQEINGVKHHFSDKECVEEILSKRQK